MTALTRFSTSNTASAARHTVTPSTPGPDPPEPSPTRRRAQGRGRPARTERSVIVSPMTSSDLRPGERPRHRHVHSRWRLRRDHRPDLVVRRQVHGGLQIFRLNSSCDPDLTPHVRSTWASRSRFRAFCDQHPTARWWFMPTQRRGKARATGGDRAVRWTSSRAQGQGHKILWAPDKPGRLSSADRRRLVIGRVVHRARPVQGLRS